LNKKEELGFFRFRHAALSFRCHPIIDQSRFIKEAVGQADEGAG
jgi:hypothetical protein